MSHDAYDPRSRQRPDIPPQPHMGRTPFDLPRPPARAHFEIDDALAAAESEHPTCNGPLPYEVAMRFSHPDDQVGIIVFTTRPHCLTSEMATRGCTFDGLSMLGNYAIQSRCPQHPGLMPWGAA